MKAMKTEREKYSIIKKLHVLLEYGKPSNKQHPDPSSKDNLTPPRGTLSTSAISLITVCENIKSMKPV